MTVGPNQQEGGCKPSPQHILCAIGSASARLPTPCGSNRYDFALSHNILLPHYDPRLVTFCDRTPLI